MKKCLQQIALLATVFSLSACSTVAGIGGSDSLSCPYNKGASCKPLSQVYKDDVAEGRESKESGATSGKSKVSQDNNPQATRLFSEPGEYDTGDLRMRPRIARVWIAPHEDLEGDLVDEQLVYVQINKGGWRVEHMRVKPESMISATDFSAPERSPSVQAQGAGTSSSDRVAKDMPSSAMDIPTSSSGALPAMPAMPFGNNNRMPPSPLMPPMPAQEPPEGLQP